jgi:hypothetical protein
LDPSGELPNRGPQLLRRVTIEINGDRISEIIKPTGTAGTVRARVPVESGKTGSGTIVVTRPAVDTRGTATTKTATRWLTIEAKERAKVKARGRATARATERAKARATSTTERIQCIRVDQLVN